MAARASVYMRRGLPFRWRRAVLTSEGSKYLEVMQTLDGRPFTEARCFAWGVSEQVEDAQMGWISRNITMFSCLPHQAELSPGDQVLVQVPVMSRSHETNGGATLTLPFQPVDSIVSITTEALVVIPATAYTVTPTGLTWGVGAPPDGTGLSIDYRSTGWCDWRPDSKGTFHLGDNGRKMPQRGQITRSSAQ